MRGCEIISFSFFTSSRAGVQIPHPSNPSLPAATLTCGAIQPALRSEEATFEFVEKTKHKKQQKPQTKQTLRDTGRCFLQPASSTIWCGGPGKRGHRWCAWYQPCFLNTRFLSVNDNAEAHGASWLPGGSSNSAFLGLSPRVRLSPSRWQASESFKTWDMDADTYVRDRVGPRTLLGPPFTACIPTCGLGAPHRRWGCGQNLGMASQWGWVSNPALPQLCS